MKHANDNTPHRGLSREESARYIGVAPTTFDRLVRDGVMPKPVKIARRKVWDIRLLDAAFDALGGNVEKTQHHQGWEFAA